MLAVLARFDIHDCRRAVSIDPTEEVILLEAANFSRIDPDVVSLALMDVLPHTKVWVTEDGPRWTGEPI